MKLGVRLFEQGARPSLSVQVSDEHKIINVHPCLVLLVRPCKVQRLAPFPRHVFIQIPVIVVYLFLLAAYDEISKTTAGVTRAYIACQRLPSRDLSEELAVDWSDVSQVCDVCETGTNSLVDDDINPVAISTENETVYSNLNVCMP